MTVEEAVETVARIGELLDSEDIQGVWHKASDFFESIQEGITAVEETIVDSDMVTGPQAVALRNWEEGVKKWIH